MDDDARQDHEVRAAASPSGVWCERCRRMLALARKRRSRRETRAPAADFPTAQRVWFQAVRDVGAELREISRDIERSGHKDARGAVIEIQAVISNLTPQPESPQQLAELERYLRDDDVVQEVGVLLPRMMPALTAALGAMRRLRPH